MCTFIDIFEKIISYSDVLILMTFAILIPIISAELELVFNLNNITFLLSSQLCLRVNIFKVTKERLR